MHDAAHGYAVLEVRGLVRPFILVQLLDNAVAVSLQQVWGRNQLRNVLNGNAGAGSTERRVCAILVNMTKAQLAAQLSTTVELNKSEAEKIIDAVFAAMGQALKAGEKLDIRGFGNFKVKDQAARVARNPRTGEAIAVPAKKVAAFKPSKELAELLNPAEQAKAADQAK